MKTTPQQRDVLRRLLGVATPRPWRENIMLTAEGQPLTAIVSGRPNPDDLRVVGSTLREPDGLLAIASANALPDLLDDLDEATQARDANARHLAAESARVGELVGQVLQLQRTLDEVVVVCDQTIDERNESRTAMLLAVKRADAVTAERDALTAKLDRVREWIDRRGVSVSDRDDAYMAGYRDAQRHALHDAVDLRRILDADGDDHA